MDQESKEKFDQQTTELYTSIGKFAVRFEHTCQALRFGMTLILHHHGLTNQNITSLLFSRLTARPLQDIFHALVSETVEHSDMDEKILQNIMNRFEKLNKNRNDVIHNAWFIGWTSLEQTDFSESYAMKPRRSKQGGAYEVFKRSLQDFLNLVDLADELTKLISRISACIIGNHKIENNFQLDADGMALLPTDTSK